MSVYQIALFLHVLGALGLFSALGIEWAAVGPLRRAAVVDDARPWIPVLRSLGRVGGPSAAVILATGVYMGTTTWGRQPWIGLSLLGLVVMAVLAAGVTGRRVTAIARELQADSPNHDVARIRLRDPALVVSLRLRTAVALGIVFLMTSKPAAGLALGAMGAAVALGLAWSAPALARRSGRIDLAR
jgi:hypothetical protein